MIHIAREVKSPSNFGSHVEDYLQYLSLGEETFLKETGIAKERMHQWSCGEPGTDDENAKVLQFFHLYNLDFNQKFSEELETSNQLYLYEQRIARYEGLMSLYEEKVSLYEENAKLHHQIQRENDELIKTLKARVAELEIQVLELTDGRIRHGVPALFDVEEGALIKGMLNAFFPKADGIEEAAREEVICILGNVYDAQGLPEPSIIRCNAASYIDSVLVTAFLVQAGLMEKYGQLSKTKQFSDSYVDYLCKALGSRLFMVEVSEEDARDILKDRWAVYRQVYDGGDRTQVLNLYQQILYHDNKRGNLVSVLEMQNLENAERDSDLLHFIEKAVFNLSSRMDDLAYVFAGYMY